MSQQKMLRSALVCLVAAPMIFTFAIMLQDQRL
jgi:hypothetical protein